MRVHVYVSMCVLVVLCSGYVFAVFDHVLVHLCLGSICMVCVSLSVCVCEFMCMCVLACT